MDFGLGDGQADELCGRLKQRRVPFVLHSGFSHTGSTCSKGVVIAKPADPSRLVDAIIELLGRQQRLSQ